MTLIKHNEICQLTGEDDFISLEDWLENKATLIKRTSPLSLLVNGDAAPEDFVEDLENFSLIAIDIPVFTDGRAYSLATLLRTAHQFPREIRAVGDVQADQALYLTRVGFDALELASEAAAKLALEKLSEFNAFYQPSSAIPA